MHSMVVGLVRIADCCTGVQACKDTGGVKRPRQLEMDGAAWSGGVRMRELGDGGGGGNAGQDVPACVSSILRDRKVATGGKEQMRSGRFEGAW